MKDIYWKLIYSASGRTQADLIAGRLKSEDIPIRLEYESVASIYAITIDGLGEVKIFVPDEFAEDARRILSEYYDTEEIPWDRGE